MEELLIQDFNKYQHLYLKYKLERSYIKCIACIDASWGIFEVLRKNYGFSEDRLMKKTVSGVDIYRL